MEWLTHLIEFRKRLIRCSVCVFILFLGFFLIDAELYAFLANPLLQHLPEGGALIATEITAPFMVPMKLAFVCATALSIPFILYQLWAFVAPGLYLKEKKNILSYLVLSTLLFYLGAAFGFYVICPLAFGFFAKCTPAGVLLMTDIKLYLDFVITLLFSAGLAFQVPIVTFALVQAHIVSIEMLVHLRPYIIVAAFVLGMLLTPPDVVSQILLALPMWGLFELGLGFSKKWVTPPV